MQAKYEVYGLSFINSSFYQLLEIPRI